MAQDRNLPEGTDKIIPGASQTGGGGERAVGTDTTMVAQKKVPGPGGPDVEQPFSGSGSPGSSGASASKRGQTGGGSSDGGSGSGSIKEKVREGSQKLTGQAADKGRDFVNQGLERSSDALSNVSRLVGETASGLDERLGSEYGDYARRAAEAIDSTAEKLRSKDPDELIDDTRDFVRKSPAVALAGAAIVGFALARLVKTGLQTATGQQSRGQQSAGDDFGGQDFGGQQSGGQESRTSRPGREPGGAQPTGSRSTGGQPGGPGQEGRRGGSF
jgi:ElaB/YqjD/DUF883 family membrane-anchored ribosome-binding protein